MVRLARVHRASQRERHMLLADYRSERAGAVSAVKSQRHFRAARVWLAHVGSLVKK